MAIGEISKSLVQTFSTVYKWKIEDVNQRILDIENGLSFLSDVFSLNGKGDAKFVMRIEKGDDTESDSSESDDSEDDEGTNVNIRLVCIDYGQSQEIRLDFKGWLENSEGIIEESHDDTLIFDEDNDSDLFAWLKMAELREFAKDDTVFVCIDIQNETGSVYAENELTARSEFGRTMLDLHSEGHYDLTIQAGDKEFKASKLALMSCSDVFRRMLSCQNSTEAQTGIIKIDDIKPAVVEAMLKWIYQVEIDNMNEIVVDLYQAADKYFIGLLKKHCINVMVEDLSKENIASRLILAYKSNEEYFKKSILNFIRGNNQRVQWLMESDEWIEFAGNYPELRKEILKYIFG